MKKTAPRQGWEKTAEEAGPHGSFGHAAMKMRRFSVFLFGILCALLVLSACSATADAAAFSGGSGTETDPYLISTAKDLWELADKINTEETLKEYTGAFYRLTNDIDLGGKKKWTPIGNYSVNTYLWFEGTFDGGGIYTVYPGGLKQEIYAGGIVGDCRLETDDEELLPVFDDLRIENCKNTGKLDGDRDPDILCTDDICASRQSRIQWTDDSDGA